MDDEKQRHGFTVLETDSEGPVNAKIYVVKVSVGKDKTFFPQKSAQAEVAVVKIDRNSGNDKDDQNGYSKSNGSSSNVNAEASVGSAQAGVWGGIGGGVEAGASGIKASVGPVSAKAGVGINTGLGIKDDSLMVEVMGSGFQVGKKMGAKILGSSVEIDLGKIIKNKRC